MRPEAVPLQDLLQTYQRAYNFMTGWERLSLATSVWAEIELFNSRLRFAELQRQTNARFDTILVETHIALLTSGETRVNLASELPIIGKLASPAGRA